VLVISRGRAAGKNMVEGRKPCIFSGQCRTTP
jgi:hypothetical protein